MIEAGPSPNTTPGNLEVHGYPQPENFIPQPTPAYEAPGVKPGQAPGAAEALPQTDTFVNWYPQTDTAPQSPADFSNRWGQLRGAMADVRAGLATAGREAIGTAATVLAPIVGAAAMKGIDTLGARYGTAGQLAGRVAKVGVTAGINKLRDETVSWAERPRQ